MDFDEYQQRANATDLERESLGRVMQTHNLNTVGFLDKALGLAGESGEVVDKIKKILRDQAGNFTEENRREIEKELGDVLWYVANTALYLGMPLSEVAQMNLDKLASRAARELIHGEGDER